VRTWYGHNFCGTLIVDKICKFKLDVCDNSSMSYFDSSIWYGQWPWRTLVHRNVLDGVTMSWSSSTRATQSHARSGRMYLFDPPPHVPRLECSSLLSNPSILMCPDVEQPSMASHWGNNYPFPWTNVNELSFLTRDLSHNQSAWFSLYISIVRCPYIVDTTWWTKYSFPLFAAAADEYQVYRWYIAG